MWKCPVCGGDPLGDDSAARAAIAPFIVHSHCHPGGRQLVLADDTRLNLSECCNLCDAKVVTDYLATRSLDPSAIKATPPRYPTISLW